jgi:hypothetical protein
LLSNGPDSSFERHLRHARHRRRTCTNLHRFAPLCSHEPVTHKMTMKVNRCGVRHWKSDEWTTIASSSCGPDLLPKLCEALNEQFEKGIETVDLIQGERIIGTVLSRDAAQKALARKVAEQWLAHPEILNDLSVSLEETPEDWD